MKKFDKSGLILCELQAAAFELSLKYTSESSAIFVRRFMNSSIAKSLDNGDILHTNIQGKDVIDRVEEQYGASQYGKVRYSANELYWIGYLYRYYCYTYEITSAQVYKTVKPNELRELFLPYHTLDPSQAIERILESKNLLMSEEEKLKWQYAVYKRIREVNPIETAKSSDF